jgi:superfamily I DNA/RNA helicase
VSRRIPECIALLCNRILPENFKLSTINTNEGAVAYSFLSDLDDRARNKLSSTEVFSYIKGKTEVFSTVNERVGLTSEFIRLVAEKYPSYDIDALRSAVLNTILEIGLDAYLKKVKIRLSEQDYSDLAKQLRHKKGSGVFLEPIHRIKGLESDTAYFIICNSLLEILLGVKNEYNKEVNLLYVALTRAKRRLLLIIDDDEALVRNFEKRKIDVRTAMAEIGVKKAVLEDWFDNGENTTCQ